MKILTILTIGLLVLIGSCKKSDNSLSDKSLIANYLLDGNATDASNNKNNGIVEGAVLTSDKLNASGKAYEFDGVNDYIRVPNTPSLNPVNAITVAAWYKTTPYVGSGNDGLVSKGFTSHVAPYYQYHLGVCGSEYWNAQSGFGFTISLNNTSKGVSTGSNFYKLNEWYFVVGTYDGAAIKLYVNGVLVNSLEATGAMKDYGMDLYIARTGNKSDYYNTTFHLPGKVDDVRIYSRALSDKEILKLYQEK
jgi:hypothetical protein